MDKYLIDEICKEAELTFIPNKVKPHGAIDTDQLDESKKTVKKFYNYGCNDVHLYLYTDRTAKAENLAQSVQWYFPNANDAFSYAKQVSGRLNSLSRLFGGY